MPIQPNKLGRSGFPRFLQRPHVECIGPRRDAKSILFALRHDSTSVARWRNGSDSAHRIVNSVEGLRARAAHARTANVPRLSLCRQSLPASGVPPPFILPSARPPLFREFACFGYSTIRINAARHHRSLLVGRRQSRRPICCAFAQVTHEACWEDAAMTLRLMPDRDSYA